MKFRLGRLEISWLSKKEEQIIDFKPELMTEEEFQDWYQMMVSEYNQQSNYIFN